MLVCGATMKAVKNSKCRETKSKLKQNKIDEFVLFSNE